MFKLCMQKLSEMEQSAAELLMIYHISPSKFKGEGQWALTSGLVAGVRTLERWRQKQPSKDVASASNFLNLNHSTTNSTSVTRWSLLKTNLIANGHKIVNLPSDWNAGSVYQWLI